MKFYMTVTMLVLTVAVAFAAPVRRLYQPVKIPSQDVLEHQTITNPAAAGSADVLSAFAGNTTTTAVTRTTFVAQPDVPRNLVITPGGTTADVGNCNIVVNGTNINGASISETFAFLANANTSTVGAKAFKTVTSVVFPANCEDSPYSAVWSVGYGEKLGLNRCMAGNHVVMSIASGVYETSRPTVAYDADEVEKNTVDVNASMDGSADFEEFYVQNFMCF